MTIGSSTALLPLPSFRSHCVYYWSIGCSIGAENSMSIVRSGSKMRAELSELSCKPAAYGACDEYTMLALAHSFLCIKLQTFPLPHQQPNKPLPSLYSRLQFTL